MDFIVALHAICMMLLSVYALHQAVLLWLYLRITPRGTAQAGSQHQRSLAAHHDVPVVTIQIPLFNERYVAERVIAAAAAQTYPRDKLHIQVLDDSTDDTTEIVRCAIEKAQQSGVCIEVVRRPNRTGFKAGALAVGLARARGELIAIFDADFVPAPSFLRRLICERRVFDDPRVGFVQTCWDYLNREMNALTRAQAMTLDIHFLIEQPARCGNGLPMNFNGSGGIWRRACIVDAGGWHYDTLTEDLDLSYRAELRGWRGVYLVDESAPSELPGGVLAYKRQQARWARGTLQTMRKLMPRILRSTLPTRCKLAAWMHLTGYFIHPLILMMSITTPILVLNAFLPTPRSGLPIWMNLISLLTLAPMVSMFVAHCARNRPVLHFLRDLPVALMLGIGVSFSNTVAMLQALRGRHTGDFSRTPKLRRGVQRSAAHAYLLRPDWTMWFEFGLAIYAGVVMALVAQWGYWLSVIPLLLYTLGFGGVWLHQLLGIWLMADA